MSEKVYDDGQSYAEFIASLTDEEREAYFLEAAEEQTLSLSQMLDDLQKGRHDPKEAERKALEAYFEAVSRFCSVVDATPSMDPAIAKALTAVKQLIGNLPKIDKKQ